MMEICKYHTTDIRLYDGRPATATVHTDRYCEPHEEQVAKARRQLQTQVMHSIRETPTCPVSSQLLSIDVRTVTHYQPSGPNPEQREQRGRVHLTASWRCEFCYGVRRNSPHKLKYGRALRPKVGDRVLVGTSETEGIVRRVILTPTGIPHYLVVDYAPPENSAWTVTVSSARLLYRPNSMARYEQDYAARILMKEKW